MTDTVKSQADPAMSTSYMAQSPMSLTLIVAATRNMGIGLSGALPWPSLKSEMAYFARVTKRAPSPGTVNAVIMGRRTWESIPPRFRPLKDRVNIVVSRRLPTELDLRSGTNREDSGIAAPSLEAAIDMLRDKKSLSSALGQSQAGGEGQTLGRVFVIGGAEVYAAALKIQETDRVLLTDVKTDFECDTFFPLDLSVERAGTQSEHGWDKKSAKDLEAWVGEEGLSGVKEEGQVSFEFCMFEKDQDHKIA
ncbi:MAG: hypothetical protein M4579_001339 [Chaenotheca gracillima]|nr:MAG: hypothetical protein M4579_001339 [Chaenotheca gracillima]